MQDNLNIKAKELSIAEKAYIDGEDNTAYKIFSKYAQEDDSYSQVCLGYLMVHGIGVDKNEEEGYTWIKKSADSHDPLGEYWYAKSIIKHDEALALKYFMLSSEQGNKDAKHDYALCLLEGIGCKIEKQKAIEVLKENFKDGHLESMRFLAYYGIRFEFGHINSIKSVYWFFKTIIKAANERYIPSETADLKCPIKGG